MTSDIDENIRYDINLVAQELARNPESTLILLDNISHWQKGKTPSLKTLWQFGLRGSSTFLYRGTRLWLKASDDPLRTFLQNGLAEELAEIEPEKLQRILEIVFNHPLIIEQQSYKNITNHLNAPEFIAACLAKPKTLLNIYEKLTRYQSTYVNFASVPPVTIDDVNNRYNEFVISLVDLASEPKVRENLKPLATSRLMDHIHEIPRLDIYPNSKKLFSNLPRNRPKESQKLVGTILSQDKKTRDKVTNAILGYTNLPYNETNDKELEKLTQKNWEEMIHSLVELASKEEVRGDLKKVATEKLIEDIYNLDALKNQQYSRTLISDLAKDNPKEFQDLVEAILASPYKETILPATTKLLAYLSSTDEKTPENEAIRADMILEFSKIAAEPRIAEKITPLLSKSFVDNLLKMEGFAGYREYGDLFKNMANTLSTKPQILKVILKAYSDTSIKAVSERALEDSPEIIEDNKQEIITEKGKNYFDSLKRMAESISSKIRGKRNSEPKTKEIELVKTSTSKDTNIADVIRKASEDMDSESIQSFFADPQLKKLIGDFIRNNPSNPNVVELNRLGVKEEKLAEFAKRIGNKEGLNALADYMEDKITISKLVAKTNNRTFVIKNLYTIVPIYYKSCKSLTPKAKTEARKEASKLSSVFAKIKNAGSWARNVIKTKNPNQRSK
ncbi:MAG: hypothetical protein N4A31_00895 [Rickettsiales bacterium]|jgi:hypothetical protein|nr:hypothetical protein [Rickettsiales bacterium]